MEQKARRRMDELEKIVQELKFKVESNTKDIEECKSKISKLEVETQEQSKSTALILLKLEQIVSSQTDIKAEINVLKEKMDGIDKEKLNEANYKKRKWYDGWVGVVFGAIGAIVSILIAFALSGGFNA